MAKKKKSGGKEESGGPGTGMILTLVFFILTTIALGITTYMGQDQIEGLTAKAKEAEDKAVAAQKNKSDEEARKIMNRIAIGIATEKDIDELKGLARQFGTEIQDEYKLISDKVGFRIPGNQKFRWPLVEALAGNAPAGDDLKSIPAAPTMTIPQIADQWYAMYVDAKKAQATAEAAQRTADAGKQQADARAQNEKEKFDAAVAALDQKIAGAINQMNAKFNQMLVEANKAAQRFDDRTKEFAGDKAKLEDESMALRKDLQRLMEEAKTKTIKELRLKLAEFEREGSPILYQFKTLDLAKLDERKGVITSKDVGGFVTLRFDRPMNLVAGQTFVVIPPSSSLSDVIDRERVLQENYERVYGRYPPRDPFAGNDLVKGMIELTEVNDRYGARAAITREIKAIQNPISRNDQLFNIAMSTVDKEHIAFAGVIDLDGDGEPNTEEFLRILEKNNIVVDQYLDLKDGTLKGRGGITMKTKFLVIGNDAPEVGKIKEMKIKAEEYGVQLIDARRFLWLIGVKPPKNPLPASYFNTNTGEEAPAKKDAPPAEPKKDGM